MACPLASGNRFSRSIRKPGRASRRLHAGCRSGRLRHLPNCSQGKGHPPVLTSSDPLSTLHRRFACARLSRPCRLDFLPRLDCNAHHHDFLAAAACSGLGSAPDCRTRRALLHLSYSCASPFGPATLVTHDPDRTLGIAQRTMSKVVSGQFRSHRSSVRSRAGDEVAELVVQMVLT